MKDMRGIPRIGLTVAILAAGVATSAPVARAQHVTAAMAVIGAKSPETGGCEDRARQAAKMLDVLNVDLERALQTNNQAQMRAALDPLQKGFADLQDRLDACRGGTSPASTSSAQAPASSASGAMAGMDHSKMHMGGATPPAASPEAAAKPPASAMDHAAMGHGAPAAASTPSTVRQIGGAAEAALQSFQDALQIGNREVALQWLAPDVTITEAGVADGSRDAYANQHMGVDMAFLKTAKVVLLDRQVHPGGESTHIISTSRIAGRSGELPVEVTVTEGAVLRNTPDGWRIVSIAWTLAPIKEE